MVPLSSIRVAAVCLVSCNRKAVDVAVREHQLAPVKARGGMFAQLCADLPWAQHLSEVSRMRDPEERSASLALRDGGPASMRRAIGWYRTHDRLYCGDAITMAADALAAHRIDTAAGKDALLVCDTTEMAAVFNNEYVRDQITYGYAVTVHSAQGVTADTTHAVLSEAAARALFYVAISRGRADPLRGAPGQCLLELGDVLKRAEVVGFVFGSPVNLRHGSRTRASRSDVSLIGPAQIPRPLNGSSRSHRLHPSVHPTATTYQGTGSSGVERHDLLVDGGDEAGAGYLTRGLGTSSP